MKTTLILADIHNAVDRAQKIINHVGADEVICLGDVFDDYNDTPDEITKAAEWFVKFVNKPNCKLLASNHDLPYRYPDEWRLRCSGFTDWKSKIINKIVSREDWDKCKFYHVLDNTFLLSHAGIHNKYIPNDIAKLTKDRPRFFSELSNYLDAEIKKRPNSWVYLAGWSRGGHPTEPGGLTWCDFNDEFVYTPGLHQIVGHTAQSTGTFALQSENEHNREGVLRAPFVLAKENLDEESSSWNFCIDVRRNTHYAVWNGKELKIGNISEM